MVKNKLRVHHYPQIPCTPFFVDVKDEKEAYFIMKVLAEQHLYLLDQGLIEDYSNAFVVVMWDEPPGEEPGWFDYYNDEEEMDWDEYEATYLNVE